MIIKYFSNVEPFRPSKFYFGIPLTDLLIFFKSKPLIYFYHS